MERIIDASNLILGRMCSKIAKKLMTGEKISIVNCEKAVMSGNKQDIFNRYRSKRERGQPTKGVFYPRRPDMFLKRIIRGMLPHKKEKGRNALKNLRCFIDIPEELKNKKIESIKEANMSKLPKAVKITVKDICRFLGGKI